MAAVTSLAPSDNVAFFQGHVPDKVQKALLQRLLECYRDASQHCYKHFRPAQAKDVCGHYRRARIEDEMCGIAERFKQIVSAKEVPYKRNTGTHIELDCGTVTITASSVSSKDDLPREADFRETLARTGQIEMFMTDAETEPPAGTKLYAILLHGVAIGQRRERCAFAYIRFPDRNFKGYLGDSINLFTKFPDLVQEFYVDAAQTDSAAEPQVRRKKSKKAASNG